MTTPRRSPRRPAREALNRRRTPRSPLSRGPRVQRDPTRGMNPTQLAQHHNIPVHPRWQSMTPVEQLDHIATRLLADSRTTTSHTEMKEEGYLSESQEERRRAREIGITYLDQVSSSTRGVFSRKDNPILRSRNRRTHEE